jgi:glycosyltransferase involved in cell wall biosynthesis
MIETRRPAVLVLASTYPRWRDDPEPGFVHELCRRLADRFDVVALVPDSPGADASGNLDGVHVLRFRYAPKSLQTLVNNGGIVTNLHRSLWKWLLVPGFVFGQYVAAKRLMKRRRIDVVHAHWLIPQGLIARRLKRLHSIPYVVTSHGGDLFGLRGKLLQRLKQKVAGSSCAMSVVSTAMRDEALRIELHAPEIRVLPMGVDLRDRFTIDSRVARVENELLFVGRLVPKKGLSHLLDAMPVILARFPDTKLTIAGFGPEQSMLEQRARDLGIGLHVRFTGAKPQKELPDLYRKAALFVAPFVRDGSGNQEGLPVVLMEAIGCGCPVIVGDVAGVGDLLGDFADAVSVNPRDSQVLASAIIDALEHHSEALQRAQVMRHVAVDRIDWQVIADGYAHLIDSCAKLGRES